MVKDTHTQNNFENEHPESEEFHLRYYQLRAYQVQLNESSLRKESDSLVWLNLGLTLILTKLTLSFSKS